jgi:glyoxylase-like metal-dependent hydrolase (beta-lactamase superfamily II)
MLGVKPAEIKFVGISHSHPDHIGNLGMFPQSTVLVQKAEYDFGTAVGVAYTFGVAAGSLAPAILGWIATYYSVAAGLPLLAISFLALAPLFFFAAPDTTRQELTDFLGDGVSSL